MINISDVAKFNTLGSKEQAHNVLSLVMEELNAVGEVKINFDTKNYSYLALENLFKPLVDNFGKEVFGVCVLIEGNEDIKNYVKRI